MIQNGVHEILTSYNIGCIKHCQNLCDKAFGKKHYAGSELVEGVLYMDLKKNPVAIIPASHILEHYYTHGFEIDRVIISDLGIDFEKGSKDERYHITDISRCNGNHKQSILVLNKRDSIFAETFLNAYNEVLRQAPEKIFPRDIKIKGASASEIDELEHALGYYSKSKHFKPNDAILGFLEEDVTGYSVKRRVDELPMYHLRQKIRL